MRQLGLVFIVLISFYQVWAQSVQGDDLVKVLGKRDGSADVNQLKSYAGSDYIAKGIKLAFDGNILTQIDLYNDKNLYIPEMQKYQGKLPHGLSFGSNIAQAKKALGEGYETTGKVSGSYVLFKDFTMGSVNAYRVNMDFYKGKINIITLIFKEGGAVAAEEAESQKKIGIRGDDFLILIKKSDQNLTATKIRGLLGYDSYYDRHQRQYLKKGFLINYDDNKRINKLTFYSGGQANKLGAGTYGKFSLPMPYGVKFTDTRAILTQKAGAPDKSTGNSIIYEEGYSNLEIFFSGGKVSKVLLWLDEERVKADKEAKQGKEDAEKQRVIDKRRAKEDSIKLQQPVPKKSGDVEDF